MRNPLEREFNSKKTPKNKTHLYFHHRPPSSAAGDAQNRRNHRSKTKPQVAGELQIGHSFSKDLKRIKQGKEWVMLRLRENEYVCGWRKKMEMVNEGEG